MLEIWRYPILNKKNHTGDDIFGEMIWGYEVVTNYMEKYANKSYVEYRKFINKTMPKFSIPTKNFIFLVNLPQQPLAKNSDGISLFCKVLKYAQIPVPEIF